MAVDAHTAARGAGEERSTSTHASATTARPSIVALVGWMAFVGLLVYIVFIGGGYSGILSGALRQLSLAIVALGLIAWALIAWRRPAWRPRTAIWPALALPFGALLLTSLTSAHPRLGLEYVAWAIVLVALYLLLVRVLAQPFARARIGGVAAILGFVVNIAYLYVAVSAWLEWWDLLGRLTAPMLRPAYAGLPFGGPTVVTSVVILLTAIAFAGLGLETRGRRITLGALGVLTAGVVVLTGSRASWLGLAVALGLVGVGLLIAYRDRLGPLVRDRLVRDRRVRIGAVAVVVAGAVMAALFAPSLMGRLQVAGDGGRGMYFATAQRMFESSPLVGVGPGNWTAQRVAFMEPGEPDVYVAHSHNIYLQTLAETGLVGALAGLLALAAIGWLIVGALRGDDADRRRWAVVATFVLLYAAVFSLVDSYVNLPLAFVLAGLPVAMLDATARRSLGLPAVLRSALARNGPPDPTAAGRATSRAPAIGIVALFVAAFGAVLVLSRVESIAAQQVAAVLAVQEGDWAEAERTTAEVVAADAGMTPYLVTRGIAAAAMGDWETARAAFEPAAATDALPQAWMDVALARQRTGAQREEVLAAIEEARRIGDQHAFVQMASAALYDELGMTAEADAAWTSLLAAIPSLAADPAWTTELVTPERFDRLLEAAIAESDLAWEVALMAGDVERARALGADSADPALASTFIDAWQGDADAVEALTASAIADPDARHLVSYAARATARAGDLETTERLRRIAVFGTEALGTPGFEVRINPADRAEREGGLTMGHGFGQNSYRRAAPGELIAPGLPSLVLVDLALPDDGEPAAATDG